MRRETETHLPKTQAVSCAFCKGTGKDPFGQLYPGSVCQVCSGRKKLFVHIPFETCSYCRGSGAAFSTQNTCTACLGRGVISLKNKNSRKKPCKLCEGTGMDLETNLPCVPCHGLGRI